MRLSVAAYRAITDTANKRLTRGWDRRNTYGSIISSPSHSLSTEEVTDQESPSVVKPEHRHPSDGLSAMVDSSILSSTGPHVESSEGTSVAPQQQHVDDAFCKARSVSGGSATDAITSPPAAPSALDYTGAPHLLPLAVADPASASTPPVTTGEPQKLMSATRSRGTQRWMKLRTTVQLTGAVTSAYKDKKPPLKREDSFLKRFSTRQTAEFSDNDYSEDDGDQSAGGNAAQNAARRRQRAARRTVINPDENFYFWWLTVITGCVLYNLWTLIVRQAFPELQEAAATLWNVADGACDLMILADIGFQFRTGYLEQGLIVYDNMKLARHYVKSRPFLLDMLSMFPLDLLRLYISRPAPLLRFPRFLKVYRSYNYYYMVESRTLYPNLWRVVNLIHVLLLLAHWFGCFYFLLSEAEGFIGEWVYPCPTGDYASLTRKYLGSLYWSTLTLTTIGDLPTPETNLQYLFTIVSYLIGVFIFATIVGQVGNVITNRNANRLEFERLLDGAKLYMRHHKVPRDMQRRVQRWYDYTWSRGRMHAGGDINTALGILPDKLKTELALHVNLNTLKKVTIFQECQPEFLHDLVLKMKAYIFTPGDLICRKGEVAREMFIIADGILEVISETGKVLTTMKAGDFFGEIGILNLDGLNRRTADVRSVGYAELFSLSRDDVLSAMKDYPEAQEILQTMGKKRLMEARKAAVNAKKEMAVVVDTLVCPPPVEVVKEVPPDNDSARQKAVLMVRRLRKDAKDLRNYLMKGSTKGRGNMMGSFKGEKSDDVRIEMEAMNSNSRDALRMSLRRRQAGGSSEDKRASIDKEDGQHDSGRSTGRRSQSLAEQGSPPLSSNRPAPTFLQRVLALKNAEKEESGATGSATAATTATSRKPSVSFECPRGSSSGLPPPETQPQPATGIEATNTTTTTTTTTKPAGIGHHWRKLKPEISPGQLEAPATTATATGTTTAATTTSACASLTSNTITTSAAALRRSSTTASEDPKNGNTHHHPECSPAEDTSGLQPPPPPSSSTTAVQAWTATVSPSTAAFQKPSSTSGGVTGSTQPQTTVAPSTIDKPSGNQLPSSLLSAAIQGLTSSNEKHATGRTLESLMQLQNLSGVLQGPTSLPRHLHSELIRATEGHAVKSILKHLSRSESDVTDLHQGSQGGLGGAGMSPSSKSKLTKTVSFRDQLEQINALAGPEADFRQQECVAELLVGIKQALQIKLDDIQNQFKTRLVALETAMSDKQDVIQNLEAKIQELETKRALDEDEDEDMLGKDDCEVCEEGDVQGLTHPNYVCHPRRSWPMLPSRQRLSHQRSQEEFLHPRHLWRAEFPSPEEEEDDDSDDVTAVGDELSSEDENEELAEAEVGAEGDDEEEEEPEEEEDDEEDDDDVSMEGDSESEILDWAGVSRFVRQCKLQQQQKAAAAAMLEEEASGAGSGNDWEIQMLAREMIKNETTVGGASGGGTKNLSDVVEEEEEEEDLEEIGEDDLEEIEVELANRARHRQHGSSPSVSGAVDSDSAHRSLHKQKSWAGAESEHRAASGNLRRDSLPVEDHIIEQFVHSTLRRLDKLEKVFTARTASGQPSTAAPSAISTGSTAVATSSGTVPLIQSAAAAATRSRSSALHHQHSLQGDPSSFAGAVAALPPPRGDGNGSGARGSRRGLLYRGISLGESSTAPAGLSLLNIPLQPGPPRMPCLTSSLGAPLVPVAHHHHPPPLSPTARLSPLARAMSTISEPIETSQLSDDASDYKNDEEDTEMECSGGNGAVSDRFSVATDEQRLPVQSPPTDDESVNECIPECQPLLGSKT